MKARMSIWILVVSLINVALEAQEVPTIRIKADSIESRQGWIRKWDGLSLINMRNGKALENVFLRKGNRLTKVKPPLGEWPLYLKSFMSNSSGQEFLVVYAAAFHESFYIMVKTHVENFKIRRKRKLNAVEVDMKRLSWADSVYVDGRRRFVRRWDSVLYSNQEGDDYSPGWLTMEVRSSKGWETGLFEKGVIGTQDFHFYRNEVDSSFWIGFKDGMWNRKYFYPIDSLSNFRVSIKKNPRPFWANRIENWREIAQDTIEVGGREIRKNCRVNLAKYPDGRYEHLFKVKGSYGNTRPVLLTEAEINENFVTGTFRFHRFFQVSLNGDFVEVAEIIGKTRGKNSFLTPLVGYLLLSNGFNEEVNFED